MRYVQNNQFFGHAIRVEFHEYWGFYTKVHSQDVMVLGTWHLKPEMQEWLRLGFVVNPDIFEDNFKQLNLRRVFDVHFRNKQDAMLFKLAWA
jgi:hypothetical protein